MLFYCWAAGASVSAGVHLRKRHGLLGKCVSCLMSVQERVCYKRSGAALLNKCVMMKDHTNSGSSGSCSHRVHREQVLTPGVSSSVVAARIKILGPFSVALALLSHDSTLRAVTTCVVLFLSIFSPVFPLPSRLKLLYAKVA